MEKSSPVPPGGGPSSWISRALVWDRTFGQAAPCLLLVLCLIYYGAYFRSGLNIAGEGGTIGVIAMRLMEGQRPIVDTFLGYNVLWFFPVVWLFELTGPNYVALSLFFFTLCTATVLLAYGVVRGASGMATIGFLGAIVPLLVPGMIFRNYLPFLAMLNMAVLLRAFVFPIPDNRLRRLWYCLAGSVAGMTWLVRVDLGFFVSVVWLGAAIFSPLPWREGWLRTAREKTAAVFAGAICMLLVHVPFFLHAEWNGYGKNFVGQYENIGPMLMYNLQKHLKPKSASAQWNAGDYFRDGRALHRSRPSEPGSARFVRISNPGTLPRVPLSNVVYGERSRDRKFAALLYFPVLFGGAGLVGAAVTYFLGLIRKDSAKVQAALLCTVSLGCALALFPQYFFFRPDNPHLSEFMVPYSVALFCMAAAAARAFPRPRWVSWALVVIFAGAGGANLGIYLNHAMSKESMGTIAARWGRTAEFHARNGVHVFVTPEEAEDLRALADVIRDHSDPGEYVVCYPYAPTINFMTDRPSYEHNLYVDNATAKDFLAGTLAEIAKHQPAVIVIDDREINRTPESRFSVWAKPAYDFIRKTYSYAGKFGRVEVYVRKGGPVSHLLPRASFCATSLACRANSL